jgi:hypothetical protein
MRVDRKAKRLEPVLQVRLPDGLVPLHLRSTPDVVDEDIERSVVALYALDQRPDFVRLQVIDADRNAFAAVAIDQFGRLFDRLRPVHLGLLRARGTASYIDCRARCAEFGGNPPACASRGAGDQCDSSLK